MLDASVKVTYRGGALRALRRVMQHRGIVPEFREAFVLTERAWRKQLRARWRKASRGGTTWRRNAQSTVDRKGHSRILEDTKDTYNAFQPRIIKTTNILKPAAQPVIHADFGPNRGHKKSKASVHEIMNAHQRGNRNLPRRKVIVGMDRKAARSAANAMEKGLKRFIQRTGVR